MDASCMGGGGKLAWMLHTREASKVSGKEGDLHHKRCSKEQRLFYQQVIDFN